KNKSDINQLYLETQKLYEKLAILKFVEENFDAAKPTIGQSEINSELETIFDKQDVLPTEIQIESPVVEEVIALEESYEAENTEETNTEIVTETPEEIIQEPVAETIPEPVAEAEEPIIAEIIEEPVLEAREETETTEELSFKTISDLKPINDFKPAFEIENEEEKIEELKIETDSKSSPVQISFEDLGINYGDAQFVKVDSFEAAAPAPSISEFKEIKAPVETAVLESSKPKTVPLNEKLAKGFHIDLNDRIAFTKNLFGNNTEDYSRVLNQLLTFDNYDEAQEFIENMVKPDYNNWEGKDDYAQRFLEIVEKKFT
ncbi:MAG: hypothetical protein ABI793_13795, partial [Flavobacterium sp.]